MLHFIRSLSKDKKGIAALEYSILAALVVLAVAAAATSSNIKTNVTAIFTDVGTNLSKVRTSTN